MLIFAVRLINVTIRSYKRCVNALVVLENLDGTGIYHLTITLLFKVM